MQFEKSELTTINNLLPTPMQWGTVIANEHQKDTPDNSNVKYVSADGHFEVIYNKNGVLLSEKNNPANMGTYNYANPISNQAGHLELDMLPFYKWQNTEDLWVKAEKEKANRLLIIK